MNEMTSGGAVPRNIWRVVGWSLAAGMLALPFVAMQFTAEVNWTLSDFVVMGTMLATVGGAIEFLVRRSASGAYRAGAVLAALAGFTLIWVNLAVGMIGSENNPANWMYAGVLAIAIGGAIVAHFRARGMAIAMIGAGLGQAMAGGIALAFTLGTDGFGWPRDVIGTTGIWTALWLVAAALFARAARHG
ncbi:hypothetical protein [Sphingomonas sp.]|uniref:hypothetical protein n=1 Tax=Sphingomonas sp. TaxID=28214 RepID=UPI002DD69F73|nr:hypothetical protein [Sphingomonas sp.]